jgi:Response regulators consisting of a CheY-like receiver domain and a winged-helix DNA-binding domain
MQQEAKKILVVDDEPKIVEVVQSYLESNSYQVYKAFNGRQALQIFEKIAPDLVILDLMMPEMTGEEVCQKLRTISRVPIIMLTAKVEEDEVIDGFKLGADDYVTKPFSPRQLMARVEAVMRRITHEAVPLASSMSFRNNDLNVDISKHEVHKKGQLVNLTPNEFTLLATLIKFPQKAFTREELVTMVLGEDYDGFDRTIDAHIKNLRQKIENDPKTPEYVLTIHGIGYKFGGD